MYEGKGSYQILLALTSLIVVLVEKKSALLGQRLVVT